MSPPPDARTYVFMIKHNILGGRTSTSHTIHSCSPPRDDSDALLQELIDTKTLRGAGLYIIATPHDSTNKGHVAWAKGYVVHPDMSWVYEHEYRSPSQDSTNVRQLHRWPPPK